MRFLLLFFIHLAIFAVKPAFAWEFGHLEYDASIQARLYPLGFNLGPSVGYGIRFWGENPYENAEIPKELGRYLLKEKSKSTFLYGFIKPKFTLGTSVFTTRLTEEIEFNPISIVGISIGNWSEYRLNRSLSVDCTVVNCGGWMNAPFLKFTLIGGYSGFFAVVSYRHAWLAHTEKEGRFYDFSSDFISHEQFQQLASFTTLLGYKIDSHWLVAVHLEREQLLETEAQSLGVKAIAGYKMGDFNFIFGTGAYGSNLRLPGFNAVFSIKWAGGEPIGLL